MFEMDEYFQTELLKEFEKFCEKNQLEANISLFLPYLIRRNIIKDITIQRYNVIKLHEVITGSEVHGTKAKVLESINERLGVSVGTVRNIVNNYQLEFPEGHPPPDDPNQEQNEERDN